MAEQGIAGNKYRGPKHHMNMRILETMVSGIKDMGVRVVVVVYMWWSLELNQPYGS